MNVSSAWFNPSACEEARAEQQKVRHNGWARRAEAATQQHRKERGKARDARRGVLAREWESART